MQRIEFQGRTAQEAKRRALSYWYQHHQSLGMSLAQFFAQCRGSQAAAGGDDHLLSGGRAARRGPPHRRLSGLSRRGEPASVRPLRNAGETQCRFIQ